MYARAVAIDSFRVLKSDAAECATADDAPFASPMNQQDEGSAFSFCLTALVFAAAQTHISAPQMLIFKVHPGNLFVKSYESDSFKCYLRFRRAARPKTPRICVKYFDYFTAEIMPVILLISYIPRPIDRCHGPSLANYFLPPASKSLRTITHHSILIEDTYLEGCGRTIEDNGPSKHPRCGTASNGSLRVWCRAPAGRRWRGRRGAAQRRGTSGRRKRRAWGLDRG